MNIAIDRPRRARTRPPVLWRLGAVSVAAVALLVACGDDESSTTPTAAATASAAAPTTAAAATDEYGYGAAPAAPTAPDASTGAASGAGVTTAETSIGTVLVDADGMTLYAFTKDTAGQPTCLDDCAGAWPPALVLGELTFGDLDASVFSTVDNPEGDQLTAAGQPLYTFAGDAAPGDVTGQGSGGVWFAVAPDGTLID